MRNIIIIFILSLAFQSVNGDEYVKAYTKQYKSQNGLYTLTVFPTYTPKNYDREMNKRNRNPEKYKNRLLKDTIIPCHAILTKTINYEQSPAHGDWRRRGLLIGGPGAGYNSYVN